MAKFVALLRGVNVGGANRVPMADLRALAEAQGWENVRSYVASGNLVFEARGKADRLAGTLQAALLHEMGVDVRVLVLPEEALRAALEACPFSPDRDSLVHVAFLLEAPALDKALLAGVKAADETLVVAGRRAWLDTPSGFGRSKLVARLEKVLGTPVTARNLRTVKRLAAMLDG